MCNCDAVPSVQEWLKDTITIRDKELLPITAIQYQFLRGKAQLSVGELVCNGGPDQVDVM